LDLEPFSSALSGVTVDLVVTGSIGACEAVRFIRALRRLGAQVVPHLTSGGAQFVTPMSLSWAAGRECVTAFQGSASHISCNDALVVAPASTNFISMVANGLMSTPASALCASYLGMKKPVILMPAAHESLLNAPALADNLERVGRWATLISPRREEGKFKFPDPPTLADSVAHVINKARWGTNTAMVSLGGTRAWIDDVRFVGNFSSGALGSLIVEELYRFGLETTALCAASRVRPRVATTVIETDTHAEMERALLEQSASAVVLAAAVLDFEPTQRLGGKVSSSVEELALTLRPTRKIIPRVMPSEGIKVGFKLEAALDKARVVEISSRYMEECQLTLMVLNARGDVSETGHRAWLVERSRDGRLEAPRVIEGKRPLARAIGAHIHDRLSRSKH
jgi:phosphopantothenoylcysteine decarboxylase/phosphopantothenate--cysteine ligase